MATKGIRYGRKTTHTGKIIYRRKTNRFKLGRIGLIATKLFNEDDRQLSTDANVFYLYQLTSRWMEQRDLIRQIYGYKGSELPDYIRQYQEFIRWFDGFVNSSTEAAELVAGRLPALAPFTTLLSAAGALYRLVRENFPIE